MNTHARDRPAARRRFALFDYGFRPFFLLAGVHALGAVGLWLWIYAGGWKPLPSLPPQLWHGHEMIYGFVAAAVAGFLLTAVPSWTGARGFAGAPLIGLVILWIAGRVAFVAAPSLPVWLIAALELSFLPALAAMLALPLLRARNRNTPMLLVLGVLWLVDVAFVIAVASANIELAQQALRLAVDFILILITIVGGRIVPAFTANALRQRGIAADVTSRAWLEPWVIATMIAIAIADAVAPDSKLSAALAAVAALAQALRLSAWRGLKSLREPIVWVLHAGYAWLPIGLALKANWLLGGAPWASHWLHAFTMGAFGSMILAVMTRAALGHTGRPLTVVKPIALAYLVLSAAAVVRVFGPAIPTLEYLITVRLAGALWEAAFALYVVVYAPILWSPRLDAKPG